MKRNMKYLIPFSLLFLLLPLCFTGMGVAQGTYGAPVQDWGIEIGDEVILTLGWDFELDFSDEIWDMIDESLVYMGLPPEFCDAKGHYENFSSIESVYNVKLGIENITSYFYNGGYYNYSKDLIYGTFAIKSASSDTYGPLNATLIEQLQENHDMIDFYMALFVENITVDDLIENLTLYGPGYDDIQFTEVWANSYSGEEQNTPSGIPIFVPTDWDITPFFNQIKTAVNYTELTYANIYASDWDDLTNQLGFTELSVTAKEVTIKFELGSMNETILDKNIYAANITNPETAERMETFDELLGFMNITNLGVECNGHVQWNRKGILENAHIDFTIEGLYNGYSFKVKPVVDISIGEHNRINTAYGVIPGYSPYLIAFTGIITISVIIIGIKKRK